MSKEQMVGLAVRLFAVFLVVYTFRYGPSLVVFAFTLEPRDYLNSAIVLSFGLSPLLIAIVLWFFPLTVAAKLLPKVRVRQNQAPLSEADIQSVAFSILGLWVLASAIPDIFYWVTYTYRMKHSDIGNPQLSPKDLGGVIATAVQFALGFLLLLGSSGIVGVIRRLRYAGK